MSDGRRSVLARIGIVALNLIWPGLGLARLGKGRTAALIAIWAAASLTSLFIYHGLDQDIGFRGYLASLAVAVLGYFSAMLFAMWRSCRESPFWIEGRPWWARWYSVLALAIGVWVVNFMLPALMPYYRIFYVASEAMSPTLVEDDRIVSSARAPETLRRGDILLCRVGDVTYIKRLAALPGDRIAMREGVVILNGVAVAQTPVGTEAAGRRLREQFPGEAVPHEIYDQGYTMIDDMDEQRVPAGHVFVLGDNRDRSADSRVPREQAGVELLPVRDIQGKALFHSWRSSGDMGAPLGK